MRDGGLSVETKKTPTPATKLAEWFKSMEGLSIEEQKKIVAERMLESDQRTCRLRKELTAIAKECEEQEQTLEDLSDMETAVRRVLSSLDEHIKILKLNESSLTVNQSILQYEAAKTRATALRKCISGRKQYEKAWEMLREVPKEDHTTMLSTLQELQNSIDLIKNCVPKASVSTKELEDQKDAFLAWQSTAFFLALQQGDASKVAEIYNTYASLDRKKEFIAIFSQGVFNRFTHVQVDRTSVTLFFEGINKEIEAQLNMFFSDSTTLAQKEFLEANECLQLVNSAIRLAIVEYDFTAAAQELLKTAGDPVKFLEELNKALNMIHDNISQNNADFVRETANELNDFLRERFLKSQEVPLNESISHKVHEKVISIDLVNGSHRAKISSFISAVDETVLIIHDILIALSNVYPPENLKPIMQKPLERVLEEILNKVRTWNYMKDSQGKARTIDDVIKVCEASGHLAAGLTRLKIVLGGIHENLSLPTKNTNKWNARVCETVLQLASTQMCNEIQKGVAQRKLVSTGAAVDLPSFSMTPSEYMTGVAQEVLQQFHKFEMFLADDNIAHAFSVWSHGSEEIGLEEDLMMRVMRSLCALVIKAFVAEIGEIETLKPATIKQLSVDAEYLREVLLDLRLPSPLLDELISKLAN